MEFTIREVVPEATTRTEFGRVVIAPPSATGKVKPRVTGSFRMCCTRAFLTDESYQKHLAEKTEHGKPIDPSKFPKINPCDIEYLPKAIFSRDSREFWMVRKRGCALQMVHSDDEDLEVDNGKDELLQVTVTDVDNSVSGRQKEWKKCKICNLSVRQRDMRRHLGVCHSGGQYKCQYCTCTFVFERSRRIHQNKMHHLVRSLPAVTLKNDILARAKKQLVSLKSSGKGKKSSECPHCGKVFYSATNFREHLNTHTGARPYECKVCGSRFRFNQNHKRHMRVAHPENGHYFCSICDCRFSSNISLGAHKRAVHSDHSKTKKSPKITKITPIQNPSLLVNPSAVLPELKLQHPSPNASNMYECHVCHKELASSQTWRGHMLIHQNLKPFKCKKCGIHFRLHGTMFNHMKVAHCNGRFACKICSCRYTKERELLKHVRQYHPKKEDVLKTKILGSVNKEEKVEILTNFKCDLCGMMTNEQELYKNHLKLHSEVTKSRCDLCLKVFTGSVPVQFHKKAAHGNGLHKCYFCCCRYNLNQALYKHLTKEHGMKRGDWNVKTKQLLPEGLRRIQIELIQTSADKWNNVDINKEVYQEFKERIHSETSEVERKYACEICHKRFIWKGSVYNHRKSAHGILGKNKSEDVLESHKGSVHRVVASSKHTKRISKDEPTTIENQEEVPLMPQVIATPEKPEKKYGCDLCSMKFVNITSVPHHKKKAHFHKGTFKCSQCSCKFLKLHGLVAHRTIAHGYVGKTRKRKQVWKLSESNSSNTQNVLSVKAKTLTDGSKKLYCKECGKFIVGKAAYRAHVKSHGKTFECDICNMKFLHRSSILTHKKRSHFHSGEIQCPKCPCKFLTAGGLLNHNKYFHKYVGKRGTRKSKHSSMHTSRSSEPHVLKNDENVVNNSETMDVNVVVEKNPKDQENIEVQLETYDRNQDKQYECDICESRFQHRSSISKHKKQAHSHKGKFKCPDCVCKFMTSKSLFYHRKNQHKSSMGEIKMLVVSKPVPKTSTFQKAKKVLKNSINRRRDWEPITCDICNITVHRKNYLKKHKETAHSNGKYRCTECCCCFHSMVGLGKHKKHHKTGSELEKQIESDNSESEPIDQVENSAATEDSRSPTSKVNRNFLKIRGSVQFPKRTSSSKSPDDSVENPSANLEKTSDKTELKYTSKPPRGTLVDSAYRFKCKLCGIRFSHTSFLRRHMKKAHTDGTIQCELCPCKFETNIGLAAHKRVYHNSSVPEYTAKYAGNNDNCTIQKTTDSTPPSPESTNIQKSFPKTKSYRKKSKKTRKCMKCSIVFVAGSNFKRHMMRAHTDGSFGCSKCSCTFLNVHALSAHKRVYHNPLFQGKGICNSFSAKIKSTTKSKKVSKSTVRQTDKTSSMIIRASTRSQDKFEPSNASVNQNIEEGASNTENASSPRLQDGINVASRKRTPKKVIFKTPEKVVVKQRRRNPKPINQIGNFPCGFCGKVFTDSRLLTRHITCHTKPETCLQCSMRFRTPNEVERHILTSHGDGMHQCYICTCRFTSAIGLRQHMSMLHKRQSSSYDEDLVIELDDSADNEPILNGYLPSYYSQPLQTDTDEFVEDSEPIIAGIIETSYSIDTNHTMFHEIPSDNNDVYDVSYSANDENFNDESEPIIQGILTFDSHSHDQEMSAPPVKPKRKAFSPKSRPIKCSTCGITCYGPDKLRQHMESHEEGDPLAMSNGDEIQVIKCSQCDYEFASMSDLMQHLQVDHAPNGQYKCVYCPCSMKAEADLQSHFMKYHSFRRK